MPAQSSELLMTGTAYIEKDIHWWVFGFRFRLYGQYSSNETIIPLPSFAGCQTTYFEARLFRNFLTTDYSLKYKTQNNENFYKVLTMQFGWNIAYNTKYYAYAYMPVTGMFYLQDEQKIGNYPFFDFFVNFQINRARIFIMTDGINTLFGNSLGKRNYMAYRYPTNDYRGKIGISWLFYE